MYSWTRLSIHRFEFVADNTQRALLVFRIIPERSQTMRSGRYTMKIAVSHEYRYYTRPFYTGHKLA